MIRVLLVEETGLLRGALSALLTREADMDVVAEAGGNGSLIARAVSLKPDVAVIDLDFPQGEDLFLGGQLSARVPDCRLLLVAGTQPPDSLRRALALGVPGLVGKQAPAEQLVEGIRKVVDGQRYIDPELALLAIEAMENPLTSRELEILRIAAEGAPTGEIADRLSLSVGTVRNHLSAVVGKVRARNLVDAIRIVRESGWL